MSMALETQDNNPQYCVDVSREGSRSRAFSPRRLGSSAAVCSASTRVATTTDLDLGPETRRPGRCGVWCYQPRVSVLRVRFRVAICSA